MEEPGANLVQMIKDLRYMEQTMALQETYSISEKYLEA